MTSRRRRHNVLDSRLVEEGTVKAHTAALEQKVAVLQQELAHQAANAADAEEDDVPWETGTVIDVRMPQERAVNVHTEVMEGQKCLVIPLAGMNRRADQRRGSGIIYTLGCTERYALFLFRHRLSGRN